MKRPSFIVALLIPIVAGCGRKPPVAGQAPTPPGARAGGAPASSGAATATATAAAPSNGAAASPAFAVPQPVPTPSQHEAMAAEFQRTVAAMADAKKAMAAAYAKTMADRKAQYEAAVADFKAKQIAEEQRQAQAAKDFTAWEKRKAECYAINGPVLNDPKASAADKRVAQAALDALPTPPALDSAMTLSPPAPPMPVPAPHGDVKSNQAFDDLLCQFRQAVEGRDHERALALMKQLSALAGGDVDPNLTAAYLNAVNQYLNQASAPQDASPPPGFVPAAAVPGQGPSFPPPLR